MVGRGCSLVRKGIGLHRCMSGAGGGREHSAADVPGEGGESPSLEVFNKTWMYYLGTWFSDDQGIAGLTVGS